MCFLRGWAGEQFSAGSNAVRINKTEKKAVNIIQGQSQCVSVDVNDFTLLCLCTTLCWLPQISGFLWHVRICSLFVLRQNIFSEIATAVILGRVSFSMTPKCCRFPSLLWDTQQMNVFDSVTAVILPIIALLEPSADSTAVVNALMFPCTRKALFFTGKLQGHFGNREEVNIFKVCREGLLWVLV